MEQPKPPLNGRICHVTVGKTELRLYADQETHRDMLPFPKKTSKKRAYQAPSSSNLHQEAMSFSRVRLS